MVEISQNAFRRQVPKKRILRGDIMLSARVFCEKKPDEGKTGSEDGRGKPGMGDDDLSSRKHTCGINSRCNSLQSTVLRANAKAFLRRPRHDEKAGDYEDETLAQRAQHRRATCQLCVKATTPLSHPPLQNATRETTHPPIHKATKGTAAKKRQDKGKKQEDEKRRPRTRRSQK